LPYFLQTVVAAVAHWMGHFGVTAWISFASRISVKMYPRVDAERLGILE
jgi:hypothetical protein